MNKLSMAKISILVSITLFSILAAAIIIILNFNNRTGGDASEEERICIGLIMNGKADDRSWGQSHYESLARVAGEMGAELVYREEVPEDEHCDDVIDELVNSAGCKVVIADSYGYGEQIKAAAERYPDVYFLHAAGSESGHNIGSFFGRMYQFRYLSGIIAGNQTKTNKIGYVAAFPIDEVNRGINAFTLGVRSVNPEAEVYVSFCGSWTDDEAAGESAETLIGEYGIDTLTLHCDSLAPHRAADSRGVWSIGYNYDNSELFPDTYLTACVWDWDSYYREQIQSCVTGKFRGEHKWLGIESGIMELVDPGRNGIASPGYSEPLEAAKARFESFGYDVFYGPVTDSEGIVRVPEGESMSDAAMLGSFDWYVEGVRVV